MITKFIKHKITLEINAPEGFDIALVKQNQSILSDSRIALNEFAQESLRVGDHTTGIIDSILIDVSMTRSTKQP